MTSWEPLEEYPVGTLVEHEGETFRATCPEHGRDCPGGTVVAGLLPPALVIEDGRGLWERV